MSEEPNHDLVWALMVWVLKGPRRVRYPRWRPRASVLVRINRERQRIIDRYQAAS